MLLNDAGERAGAELLVVALLDEPLGRVLRELDRHAAIGELRLELEDELLHDLRDHLRGQAREGDHRVETIAELRREHLIDGLGVVAVALRAREAHRRLGEIGSTRVRRHDEDDVAEVDLTCRCGR